MDPFTKDDLQILLEDRQGLCVSIFMPTVRAGDETQQNPIRFKNLLRQAEDRLVAAGLRAPEAKDLTGPLMEQLNDEDYWRRQGDGLAVFLAPGFTQMYRLPRSFAEQVVVARRFHIKPLLPLLSLEGRFYILALSQNRVRLLEGSRFNVRELELEDVPTSLAEALRWDDPERQLQAHATKGATTGGERPTPVFHGHGAGKLEEKEKDDLLRFFQKVDAGLRDYVEGERIPLVLAGVDYLLPIYRQASDYPYLAEPSLSGNQDDTRSEELHEQAWEILEPQFKRIQAEAAALYRQQAGMQARASDRITEIVPAAYYGRVGQLFVQEGAERWGTFDGITGQVKLHESDQPTPEDMDLLDFAAAFTFINNGEVYLVEPEEMPEADPAAAVLRY